MTIDVRLVNTWETKDVYLDNVSDSDLMYSMKYRVEFVPDTGMIEKVNITAIRLLSY